MVINCFTESCYRFSYYIDVGILVFLTFLGLGTFCYLLLKGGSSTEKKEIEERSD